MPLVNSSLTKVIIDHFLSLGFWARHWNQSAVVIVASSVRGMDDQFTDVDVIALVDRDSWSRIYDHYRREIDEGHVRVLNPAALEYGEFPLTLIEGVKGHYKVETFEDLERKVEEYDDVTLWVHRLSRILHDPGGRYERLQHLCADYPEDIWRSKVRHHYLSAWWASGGAKNPLRRNPREGAVLAMTRCVSLLLKLCCLMDRRPFPYEKWLYQEAMNTAAGAALRGDFEKFFRELGRAGDTTRAGGHLRATRAPERRHGGVSDV